MAEDVFESEDRTEPATPRKLEEARERGQVARSTDLNSALVLLAAMLAFHFFGRGYFDGMAQVARHVFGTLDEIDFTADSLTSRFGLLLWLLVRALGPFLAAVLAVALASNWVQVGFLFTGTPLTPTWSKIDPIQGFKRMFSMRALVRLAAGLLKLAVIAGVLWWTLSEQMPALLALPALSVPQIAAVIADCAFAVAIRAAIALTALGILDFAFQRFQYARDLRMSKQEVKEELKRLEGNPRVRERRRAIQRQLAMQRMMAAVPKAAVVVTNPTHLAVALAYDEKMAAPKVVAKGADLVAERIREVAHEYDVPIIQKPPLAQALFKGCEVGQEVPPKLYEAVAEILAYVYSLKKVA
ncbi:MAG: flagellar biosynthesis protein FlhB [Planctomycetes bacterium]|nr:flagellar biosynthesis protein FlhB [Planctomycetota bacterium]